MMKNVIFTMLLAATLSAPTAVWAGDGVRKEKAKAYRDAQKVENKAFRDTLKNIPESEREAAVINHRNKQFEENMANHARLHAEHMAKLQSKLAGNSKLTDAQKQEILTKAEQNYQDSVVKAKTRHTENINYAQQIHSDPSLTPEQKRAKMKEYLQAHKAKHQAAMQEKKAKRESLREK